MATKLNQIIAIEGGTKTKVNRTQTDLYKKLQKDDLFVGLSRTYIPKDEDGDKLPAETSPVLLKASSAIDEYVDSSTRLFDVILTKDTANTQATADVVVDGDAILKNVPVTYLLFLEKQLVDVMSFIRRIPVLDPAQTWEYDSNRGFYVSKEVETTRTKKVPKVLVKYAATKEHQAQTEVYTEDVIVGTWKTQKFSGGLPADRIAVLTERVETLITAVKYAREQANDIEITDRSAGKEILGYLFK